MKTLKTFKQFNESIKTDNKLSKIFTEVHDMGDEKYFIRHFGNVEIDDERKVNLMCIANIQDLRASGAVSDEELHKDGDVVLRLAIYPYINEIAEKFKEDGEDISDIFGTVSGIPLDNYKEIFKTIEEAETYLLSTELNKKIDGEGFMVGFIMDKPVNNIGSDGWDLLYMLLGIKDDFMPRNRNESLVNEKKYNTASRKELLKKGYILKDLTFPIVTKQDLTNAIKDQGRSLFGASADRKKEVLAHIHKRAKDLGVELVKNSETGYWSTQTE